MPFTLCFAMLRLAMFCFAISCCGYILPYVSMVCHASLCYALLSCAWLRCALLQLASLWLALLCYVLPYFNLLCLTFVVPCYALLCYAVLCCPWLRCTLLWCALLSCAPLGNAWQWLAIYGPPRRLLRQTVTKLCYALLCFAMPCYAMACFAMLGYACCACFPLLCFDFGWAETYDTVLRWALLCYASLYFAFLRFALLCFAMLCSTLLCFAVVCYALLCLAFPCLAMLWFAMLCLALLCLALLSSDFALILRLACLRLSLSRIGQTMREIHMILQQFSPDRKFFGKMLFSAPFLGGTTAEPQKWKNYSKNVTENHDEKSRADFWRNLWEILHSRCNLAPIANLSKKC